MRAITPLLDDATFRRAIEALDGLPIRPAVARQVYGLLVDESAADAPAVESPGAVPAAETDPGWALAWSRRAGREALTSSQVLLDRPWWSTATASPGALDGLARLWRHAVAVAFAARRLAREANDPDPDRVARAGLLHPLGLWAVAATDPERLLAWLDAAPTGRLALERRWFGMDLSAFGRRLAERWGCDPLVVDAAWLHADSSGDLNPCAAGPARLAIVQQAYALARRTPWSVAPHPDREFGPVDPLVRVLTAEVQSRTGTPFVAPDASSREEALTRDNLRLRRRVAQAEAAGASAARLAASLADSEPAEAPQAWADRAALAWCQEPGVATARVVWRADPGEAEPEPPALAPEAPPTPQPEPSPRWVRPLGDRDRPGAELMIWEEAGAEPFAPSAAVLAGWDGWARVVADRERLGHALDRAVAGHRGRVARDEAARGRAQLDALAEFAAGAGHELNNPLAVIMGRAQLVLARSPDVETSRSLRAIIAQAQRAHRILRDLMFVARPAGPRPRACQPDDVVRASLRDLKDEADAQGVRIVHEAKDPAPRIWADPEPLRQVADILARNALEATPSGGTIRFSTGGDARQIRWTVHDGGRGISPAEGAHLFDPFYCGRQAGRGLGLGLPRAARVVEQAGGEIRWRSAPDQGTRFHVTLPIREIPAPAVPPAGGTESGAGGSPQSC